MTDDLALHQDFELQSGDWRALLDLAQQYAVLRQATFSLFKRYTRAIAVDGHLRLMDAVDAPPPLTHP